MTLILTDEDVAQILPMTRCLTAIEETFLDLGRGVAVSRPRTHTYTWLEPDTFYNFKSMDGGVPRYGVHALRISSEILQSKEYQGHLREEKLARAPGGRFVGLVFLFDMQTTAPLAIMQEAQLQRMRVGATSAIAAKVLARENSSQIGIFGSGWQALPQIEGLASVRKLEKVKVYSTNPANRNRFAEVLRKKFSFEVAVLDEPRAVVEGSDIVVCATNSSEPVFDGDWLVPGQHVNSLQAGELDVKTLARVDIIGVRAFEKSLHFMQKAAKQSPFNFEKTKRYDKSFDIKLRALGEIVAGQATGRMRDEEITLFGGSGTGPSSGLGIQFAAVAKLAYDAARERGLGRDLPTEWFTQTHHA
jgi:alanine dehydrogenase